MHVHAYEENNTKPKSKSMMLSDPAKQTNFWDMAMARANELANFNIVVEKWDSSKIGGKRGSSKGKQGGAKGYTTARASMMNTIHMIKQNIPPFAYMCYIVRQ
jgi:hypothetical protein